MGLNLVALLQLLVLGLELLERRLRLGQLALPHPVALHRQRHRLRVWVLEGLGP